jgi:hypothetical protein
VVRAGDHRIDLAAPAGLQRGGGRGDRGGACCGVDLSGAVATNLASRSSASRPSCAAVRSNTLGGPYRTMRARVSIGSAANAFSAISGPMPLGSPAASARRRGA